MPPAASGAPRDTGPNFYEERVSSPRTTALFLVLTLLFLSLLTWRAAEAGPGLLTTALFGLCILFLLYSLNYRTLSICMTPETLRIGFGIFTWTVPFDAIESCRRDETSLLRIGGAGIHFTMIHGRYRVMLNFLEHPRVIVALKRKRGLVKDVVFSTTRPEEVKRLLSKAACGRRLPADGGRQATVGEKGGGGQWSDE